MNIAILTSSRADFGIYLPLLKKLKEDSFFNLDIVAFGTHLSKKHGYTKTSILESGFEVKHEIETTPIDDTEEAISKSIGETIIKFATFWAENKASYDLVLCLGDRYEMFAAVTAGITFNIKFAHLHAGEKTLGAIDNIFRHSITLSSTIHFTSTEEYKERVLEMIDLEEKNVTNVGALSLDELLDFKPLSIEEMKGKFGVDMSIPTILTTFHPETVASNKNEEYAITICKVIANYTDSSIQFLITMPNADTAGNVIRAKLKEMLGNQSNVIMVENLGSIGYFSAMKYCKFLFGNTSSGIIEAASFNKYVVNVGDRQKGRTHGTNVVDVSIEENSLKHIFNELLAKGDWVGENIYFQVNAALRIIDVLKKVS